MENKLTDEQKKVLSAENKSVIVSAAAGSGKTTILIDKIMSCIVKGINLENILALTFTNLAAEEMKIRLANKLSDEIERTEKINLLTQLDFLPQSDISTFHSFYEKLLKKYFYIVNISPNFEIISEEMLLTLKELSFNQALQNLKEKSFEKYIQISDILGKRRSNNSIKERIFKLDNFLSSQFNREKFLKETTNLLYKDKQQTLSIFFAESFYIFGNAAKKLENIFNLAKSNQELGLCSHINECLSVLSNTKKDYKEFYNFLCKDFKFPALRENNKLNLIKTENFFKVKEIKEEVKNFVNKFKEKNYGSFDNILNSFDTCKNNIDDIINLYSDYEKILIREKQKINKYDFSDLERFCYELLQKDEIREEIKNKYIKIFIDEYQDINPIQGEILRLISNENVFYVGDAKQSIYSFRQSDVDIFINTCKELEEADSNSSLKLTHNFRSNTQILNFVNNVFNEIMTNNSAQIDYEKEAKFNLDAIPGSLNKIGCEDEGVKIICVLENKDVKTELVDIYNPLNVEKGFKEISVEAKCIASEIKNLLSKKITNKFGEEQNITFDDIAILVRKRSDLVGDLVEVFKKCHIPFEVNDEIDLLYSKENQLIYNLLKLLMNKNDDESIAPIMVSDLYNFTYEDLSKISLIDKWFFHERCLKYLEEKQDAISEKICNFNSSLENLRFLIQNFGIKEGLFDFLNKNGYFTKVLKKENGKQKLDQIKLFLNHIKNSGCNHDLYGLLKYLENNKKIKSPQIKESNNNCVKITTIHSSKGLEFPVVILADAGSNLFSNKNDNADLKIDKDIGIAIKNYNIQERKVYNSIFETIILKSQRKKEIAENLRLLYVALTRAKNKLIITGKIKDVNENQKEDIEELLNSIDKLNKESDLTTFSPSSYLYYILGAIKGKEINGINIICENGREIELSEPEKKQKVSIKDLLRLKNNIGFTYKNIEDTNTSAKTSVSLLAFDGYGYESIVSNLNTLKTKEHLNFNFVEEGNLMHEILEKINLYEQNLSVCIERLINEKDNLKINKKEFVQIIENNVKIIREIIPENSKIFREKEFILYESPYVLFKRGSKEKVLIQGKIDLCSFGSKNILIDYKYTSIKDNNRLILKYKNQLKAYSYAIEKATGQKVDETYLLSLKNAKLIKINF